MKKLLSPLLALSFLPFCSIASGQEMPLYGDNIPNSKPTAIEERSEITPDKQLFIYQVSKPTLSVFLPPPKIANKTAVVICPGGGYYFVSASHEGADVAKKLNEIGVAAFVLKYRIPSDESMVKKEIGPLPDVQRALQTVRENASKWNVDPNRVGVMGFSAGGHLAATAGTHFSAPVVETGSTRISRQPHRKASVAYADQGVLQ
jgi:acetyl esterase/lipase